MLINVWDLVKCFFIYLLPAYENGVNKDEDPVPNAKKRFRVPAAELFSYRHYTSGGRQKRKTRKIVEICTIKGVQYPVLEFLTTSQ